MNDNELIRTIHELTEPSENDRQAIDTPLGSDFENRIVERALGKRRRSRKRPKLKWLIIGLTGAALVAASTFFVVPLQLAQSRSFELEVVGGDRLIRGEEVQHARKLSMGSVLEVRLRPVAGANPSDDAPTLWLERAEGIDRVEAVLERSPEGALRWRLMVGGSLPAEPGTYELRIVFPGDDPALTASRWRVPFAIAPER